MAMDVPRDHKKINKNHVIILIINTFIRPKLKLIVFIQSENKLVYTIFRRLYIGELRDRCDISRRYRELIIIGKK